MRSSTPLLALAPAAMATTSSGGTIFATSYNGTVDTIRVSVADGAASVSHAASLPACGSMPSWLTLDKGAGTLYCSNEAGTGAGTPAALSALSLSAGSANLTVAASAAGMGGGVNSHLYGGPSGDSFLVVAGYETSSLFTWALPLSSTSQTLQTFTFNLTQPATDPARQDAPHPHQATTDPTGRFVLVPDLGADVIRRYAVDADSGNLTQLAPFNVTGGTGPRHVAFYQTAAGATVMYLVSELANTLQSFRVAYGGANGIDFTQDQDPVFAYPSGVAPNNSYIAEVQVVGQTLTVSNRGDLSFGGTNDSLAVYNLDSAGSFSFKCLYDAYGSYPRTFVINKAGDLVAVGNQDSFTVVVLARDPATGALGDFLGSVKLGGQVSSVVWDE